jgi:release factor glutamine methyltransferase
VERTKPLAVIDVGTGSGAVAVAVAVALRARRVAATDVEITAVDISADALDLARENAVGHGVGDRIVFATADLLPPEARSRPFDVVLANLPYVRTDELDALEGQPVSTTFEPRSALDGGPDGLAVIDRLLEQVPWGLAADGIALLEIGSDQAAGIQASIQARLAGWTCEIVPDLAGLARVAAIRRPAP